MENANNCPVKGCLGKWVLSSIPVFIFLFIAGYVVNHLWLMPVYQQTAALWRPMEQMKEFFPWLILYYATLSLVITALYCKIKKAKMQACAATGETLDCKFGGKNCWVKSGVCFGLSIGMLLGITNAAAHIWLPIPGELAIKWFISWVVQGIGIGLILSFMCNICKKKS